MASSSKNLLRKEIKKNWKPRKPLSHKGDFGRVLVIAGSRGYSGAAMLASEAVMRTGAGLITLAVPSSIYAVVARREKEVMVRDYPSQQGAFSYRALPALRHFAETQDVLAIGPGVSKSKGAQKMIRELAVHSKNKIVLDADGLNAFENHQKLLFKLKGRVILTPHPGEFYRLFGQKILADNKRGIQAARRAAVQYGFWIVLKGHRSVMAAPDGKVFLNSTGNPGMASGGTGDVLTGILAGLLAQKFSFTQAMRYGVFLHGMAGDLAAKKFGEASMTAGDLISVLPAVIKKIRGV